ncbi:MAG: hypothetical protein D6735_11575 [Acidobacteria bacterium]|nr:MAG: hypothetical protein D6735_11575 [Acidobacteriota bacterium]
MTKAAIVCGLLLILVAFIGYGYGLAIGNASLTALIPLVFGVVLLALGFFAQKKDELRKTLMHIAVVVASIGFLVPLSRIISTINQFTLNFAAAMLISMTLICLIFVILAVKSFVDARRSRQS